MRLLITRPRIDADRLMIRLAELGHMSLSEPMFTIIPCSDVSLPDREDIQALLITSTNGVRAASANKTIMSRLRSYPVLAVGEATAHAARALGFSSVMAAGGDVASLANLVRHQCRPEGGLLVHLAGAAIAGDLRASLATSGFDLIRCTLYRAVAQQKLSVSARRSLSSREIDGVLLYSPRTAAIFSDLTDLPDLHNCIMGLSYYCLSAAVANSLRRRWPAARCFIAPAPQEDDLLRLLPGKEVHDSRLAPDHEISKWRKSAI